MKIQDKTTTQKVPKVPFEEIRPIHRGKTRDTYNLPDHKGLMLIVASDRLSTHNVVHKSTIPHKGEVLTALTIYWIKELCAKMVGFSSQHHLVASGREIAKYIPSNWEYNRADLFRTAIVVKRLQMVPIEFIFRSYMCGSLYKRYHSQGIENPYGLEIPSFVKLMTRFPKPIFTPTEKSETDDPVKEQQVRINHRESFGLALAVYRFISCRLRDAGLEMIDSKFEVGFDFDSGEFCIADEIGTPDSSRFCRPSDIVEGQEPKWLDKQIARDVVELTYGKKGPFGAMTFDRAVIDEISETYEGLFRQITGMSLPAFQKTVMGLVDRA